MIFKKPKIDPRAMEPMPDERPEYGGSINPQAPGVARSVTPEPQLARPRPQLLRERFNRKFFGKGADYRPGTAARQPSIREVPAIEESLYDLDDDLG